MLLFRNDDVSSNTNIANTQKCYETIIKHFKNVEIISAVSVLCSSNRNGSVYAEVPFKNNPINWFYNINSCFDDVDINYLSKVSLIASHGLIHVDHSKISYDAQEMSIVSSCQMLHSNIFVPPFNKYNDITKEICILNNIKLIDEFGTWKSLEHEPFNFNHKYWYFHSWKWTPEKLKEKLINANFTIGD